MARKPPPPFESEPIAQEIYALIGRIIVGWSHIERSLDIAVAASSHLREPRRRALLPLEAKIRALRETCDDNPDLAKGRNWILDALDEMQRAAKLRHTLVHGYCHGIETGSEPTIHIRKARYDPHHIESEEIRATRNELWHYLLHLRRLGQQMGLATMFVCIEARKIPPRKHQSPGGS